MAREHAGLPRDLGSGAATVTDAAFTTSRVAPPLPRPYSTPRSRAIGQVSSPRFVLSTTVPAMPGKKPTTVDEYIGDAPEEARPHLRRIREILGSLAPGATEAIKWGYPVLEEKRILFSFSAHRTHLNFMPTGPAMVPFAEELAGYRTGKDTIQFPYDRPLPEELIRTIAAHRLKEVRENDARWMY